MRGFLLSTLLVLFPAACSGSDDAVVPAKDTAPTSPSSPSGSSSAAPSAPRESEGKDAGASDASDAPSPKDAGPAKEPGCVEACAKAYACKMVSSPKSCVCGGKAGSAECAKCWLSHSCDELKSYACYGACN